MMPSDVTVTLPAKYCVDGVRCWVVYVWVCRVFGILTAIGLWGVSAETVYRGDGLGIYLLCAATVTTFTETIFIVNFWLSVCISDSNSSCLRCWNYLLWLDNWKKCLLYLLLSIGCFVCPVQVWIAIVSGAMLVVCGLLYLIKTVKAKHDRSTKNRVYNRFNDDVTDMMVDSRRIVRDVSSRPLPVEQLNADNDDV